MNFKVLKFGQIYAFFRDFDGITFFDICMAPKLKPGNKCKIMGKKKPLPENLQNPVVAYFCYYFYKQNPLKKNVV